MLLSYFSSILTLFLASFLSVGSNESKLSEAISQAKPLFSDIENITKSSPSYFAVCYK